MSPKMNSEPVRDNIQLLFPSTFHLNTLDLHDGGRSISQKLFKSWSELTVPQGSGSRAEPDGNHRKKKLGMTEVGFEPTPFRTR